MSVILIVVSLHPDQGVNDARDTAEQRPEQAVEPVLSFPISGEANSQKRKNENGEYNVKGLVDTR